MNELNEFTGMSDRRLQALWHKLVGDLRAVRDGDGHGGSPGEGIAEELEAVEREINRRFVESNTR